MSFVVDASIAGSWFLPDEAMASTMALARRMAQEGAAAPNLLWHEVRNLLLGAFRRGRLIAADLEAQLDALEALPIRDAGRGEAPLVARLCVGRRLTSYDAAYLAVALADAIPLASLDRELRSAARAEGVALLPKTI